MAELQHTQLRRERPIGTIIRDGQADILARAVEAEAWIPLKRPVKAEGRNSMEPPLQMRMGAVRTWRLEGTMLGGAPGEDRPPRDWDALHIRRGCWSHAESYSSLDHSFLVYYLSVHFIYNTVRIKVTQHLSDMELWGGICSHTQEASLFCFFVLYISERKIFSGEIRPGRLRLMYKARVIRVASPKAAGTALGGSARG